MENITPSIEQIREHVKSLSPREMAQFMLQIEEPGVIQHFLDQVKSTPLQTLISENMAITLPVANVGGRVVKEFSMGVTMRYTEEGGSLFLSNGVQEVNFSQAIQDSIAVAQELVEQEKR